IEDHLQVIPSELEIIKQDFEKKSLELGKKIEQLEEEKMSLHQYRSCNSAIELKASINKIEELKEKIEKLKTALQNCKLQVELLEANNEHWKEQLQRS
ncbi:hypothetical protein Goshw_027292, partial [Gossypium schwendimanii]|nr:hypothetical protein [Gossypium schwendimanii]